MLKKDEVRRKKHKELMRQMRERQKRDRQENIQNQLNIELKGFIQTMNLKHASHLSNIVFKRQPSTFMQLTTHAQNTLCFKHQSFWSIKHATNMFVFYVFCD